MSAWYTCDNDTVIVNLYVQPGAKRTEVVGFYGDELKIRLMSQPIDGRANDALLKFVAKWVFLPIVNTYSRFTVNSDSRFIVNTYSCLIVNTFT